MGQDGMHGIVGVIAYFRQDCNHQCLARGAGILMNKMHFHDARDAGTGVLGRRVEVKLNQIVGVVVPFDAAARRGGAGADGEFDGVVDVLHANVRAGVAKLNVRKGLRGEVGGNGNRQLARCLRASWKQLPRVSGAVKRSLRPSARDLGNAGGGKTTRRNPNQQHGPNPIRHRNPPLGFRSRSIGQAGRKIKDVLAGPAQHVIIRDSKNGHFVLTTIYTLLLPRAMD